MDKIHYYYREYTDTLGDFQFFITEMIKYEEAGHIILIFDFLKF